jgi:excisionase family DNA binding protein
MIQKKGYLANQRRPVMTLSETAAVLGVSYPTAHKWAHDGYLPTVKIGPKTFVLREPFMRLLADPGRRPAA